MEIPNVYFDLCRAYIEDLPHYPWKENVIGMVRSRNLAGLCGVRDTFGFASQTPEEFSSLLQIEAFFKKNEDLSDPERCRAAAVQSFLEAEDSCRSTNLNLAIWHFQQGHTDPDLVRLIERVRSRVCTVLGRFDSFRDSIPKRIRITAGATSVTGRRSSKPFLKVKKTYRAPSRGSHYLTALAKYFGYSCRVIGDSCNRVEFVPKNWKTYRTIACEPDGAMPFQLAFDSFVKERLHRYGTNLRSQSRNQELARRGSVDGCYATIDLQSASDTVSLNVVHLLFPREWVEYLLSFRSHLYTGKFIPSGEYEKFSSMGNGSTFAIETLVFEACCWAVGSRDHGVYGDDIAIRTEYANELRDLLHFLGFTVNEAKSFSSGPYRESCGSHWFNGVLVTPFFVRGRIGQKPFLTHTINGLSQVCLIGGKLSQKLVSLVRENKVLIGPFSENSTSCVWVSTHFARALGKLRHGPDYRDYFRGYVLKERTLECRDSRALFLWYLTSVRIPLRKEPLVTSRYTEPVHGFRVRRLEWHMPSSEEPATLPAWSEFMSASLLT